jgi:hypothetical protein
VTIYLIVTPVDPIAQRIKAVHSFYFEDHNARNKLIALVITNGKTEFEMPKHEESPEESKK